MGCSENGNKLPRLLSAQAVTVIGSAALIYADRRLIGLLGWRRARGLSAGPCYVCIQ